MAFASGQFAGPFKIMLCFSGESFEILFQDQLNAIDERGRSTVK